MRSLSSATPRALAAAVALLLSLPVAAQTAATPPAAAQPVAAQGTSTPAPVAAKPTPAARASVAPVLLGDAAANAKLDLARWGLTQADMSLLDSSAIDRKIGLARRAGDLAKGRAQGDPVAIYLSSLLELSQGNTDKANEYSERAVELGVVRAISMRAARDYLDAETEAQDKDALDRLKRAAGTGSAFGAYWLANALMLGNMGSGAPDKGWMAQSSGAMGYAAEAGYAPAQLWAARRGFDAIDRGNTDPKLRQMTQTMLDRAVAQGNPEAIELAASRKGK